jgi:outer membrane protein OmpA-like peptidoglycan-associated protein
LSPRGARRALTAAGFALALLLAGAAGAQSEARWIFYRDFWFDYDSAVLDTSDRDSIRDIAYYLGQHASHRLAIDSGAASGTLRDQRIAVVRNALIAAGVPKSKIQEGRFGDERLRRERRVEVLINSRE